jgi:hypothetical protein
MENNSTNMMGNQELRKRKEETQATHRDVY